WPGCPRESIEFTSNAADVLVAGIWLARGFIIHVQLAAAKPRFRMLRSRDVVVRRGRGPPGIWLHTPLGAVVGQTWRPKVARGTQMTRDELLAVGDDQPQVFISYARKDAEAVGEIAHLLEEAGA